MSLSVSQTCAFMCPPVCFCVPMPVHFCISPLVCFYAPPPGTPGLWVGLGCPLTATVLGFLQIWHTVIDMPIKDLNLPSVRLGLSDISLLFKLLMNILNGKAFQLGLSKLTYLYSNLTHAMSSLLIGFST